MNTVAEPAPPGAPAAASLEWLRTGDQAYSTMLEAIDGAQHTVRFETYIFKRGEPGDRIRAALISAAQRGVHVYALLDAGGSTELPADYWNGLIHNGGEFRWFNRPRFLKGTFRNHRKLLVVDDRSAYVGGYNIAPEHCGDGVTGGWKDIGIFLHGSLAAHLGETFDKMFTRAELKHRAFIRVMKTGNHAWLPHEAGTIIISGPGRGFSQLKRSLKADLRKATDVRIMAAYFLPTYRLRRTLLKVARRGHKVQLIVPGKSDVLLSQLATRKLYQSLMRAGVEIYEYEPQVLHAKMIIIDDSVYVGSANLDTRSLYINYELSVRLNSHDTAEEARELFDDTLTRCRRVNLSQWRKSRGFIARWKEKFAYWLLTRFDLYLARKQLNDLR
jgi:cardiolipin synthase